MALYDINKLKAQGLDNGMIAFAENENAKELAKQQEKKEKEEQKKKEEKLLQEMQNPPMHSQDTVEVRMQKEWLKKQVDEGKIEVSKPKTSPVTDTGMVALYEFGSGISAGYKTSSEIANGVHNGDIVKDKKQNKYRYTVKGQLKYLDEKDGGDRTQKLQSLLEEYDAPIPQKGEAVSFLLKDVAKNEGFREELAAILGENGIDIHGLPMMHGEIVPRNHSERMATDEEIGELIYGDLFVDTELREGVYIESEDDEESVKLQKRIAVIPTGRELKKQKKEQEEYEENAAEYKEYLKQKENARSVSAVEADINETEAAKAEAEEELENVRSEYADKLAMEYREGPGTPDEPKQESEAEKLIDAAEKKVQELEEKLIELEEEKNQSKFWYYQSLMDNEDFESNSQYVSTANGKEVTTAVEHQPYDETLGLMTSKVTYEETGYDDDLYEYINGNEDAKSKVELNEIMEDKKRYGTDSSYLEEMTEDEVGIYNYLYATVDADSAEDYLEFITGDLNYRQRKKREEEAAAYANEHPAGASVLKVATSPLKVYSYAGQLADYAEDGEIDQNAGYNRFVYEGEAIQNEVSTMVQENWGGVASFGYNLGMGLGETAVNIAVGGGSPGSLVLMGSGAAATTTMHAKDRGLSDDEAIALGTIAGAAEIITEKVSLDALFNTSAIGKGAVNKYLRKNILEEGREEVTSSFINLFSDIIIAKDKSQWNESINAYMEQGDSEDTAFWKALVDQVISMGIDYIGGAISGATFAGAVAGPYVARNISNGKKIIAKGQTNEYIQAGLQMPQGETAYTLAAKNAQKIKEGKKLSAYTVGKQAMANAEALYNVKEGTSKGVTRKQEKELNKIVQESGITNQDDVQGIVDFSKPMGNEYGAVSFEGWKTNATEIANAVSEIQAKNPKLNATRILNIAERSAQNTQAKVKKATGITMRTELLQQNTLLMMQSGTVTESYVKNISDSILLSVNPVVSAAFDSATGEGVSASQMLQDILATGTIPQSIAGNTFAMNAFLPAAQEALNVSLGNDFRIYQNVLGDSESLRQAVQSFSQRNFVTTSADSGIINTNEEDALLAYKSADSYRINEKLREGIKLDAREMDIVNGIDSALQKLPVYEGTVYRNLTFDYHQDGESARNAFLAQHKVGEIVRYKAYTSVSIAIDGHPLDGKHIVNIVIEGINGRTLEGIGNNFEKEVLFPRDSTFIPTKVETDASGIPTIYMKEYVEGIDNGQGNTERVAHRDTGRGQTSNSESGTPTMQQMQETSMGNSKVRSIPERNPNENFERRNGMPQPRNGQVEGGNGNDNVDFGSRSGREESFDSAGETGRVSSETGRTEEGTRTRGTLVREVEGKGNSYTEDLDGRTVDAKHHTLSEEQKTPDMKEVESYFKSKGLPVQWMTGATITGKDGKVSSLNGYIYQGKVYLSIEYRGESLMDVARHEYFHHLVRINQEGYAEFRNLFLKTIQENGTGATFVTMRQGYNDKYKGVYSKDNAASIDEEFFADFAAQYESREDFQALVGNSLDVRNAIRSFYGETTQTAETAGEYQVTPDRVMTQDEYRAWYTENFGFDEEAFNEAWEDYQNGDEPKFEIAENSKGKYVQADRQVIHGKDPEKWGEQIENYINQKIRNGEDVTVIAEDGDLLTITSDTSGKAKFRNSVLRPDGRKTLMTDEEYRVKLEAESHIDELAAVSKRGKKIKPDYKNHPFAKDGFNYRTAYFLDSTGDYYRITISVGINGEINTIYNVGKMDKIKEAPFLLMAQRPGRNSAEEIGTSDDTNVSQNDPDVNSSVRTETENDTQQNEQSESGARFSIAGGDIFKAPDSVTEGFSAQIDSWLSGVMESEEQFRLGDTPAVLRALGAKKLPMVMSQSVMAKITGEKHNISLDEIRNLPNAVADPIMVFRSESVPNAFIILTELIDKSGNDVVAALHLNRAEKHIKINRIASVYGKEHIANFVQNQISLGNLKYFEQEKSQDWSQSRGLQLPKLADTNPDNNIILQKEDVVKYSIHNNSTEDSNARFSIASSENMDEFSRLFSSSLPEVATKKDLQELSKKIVKETGSKTFLYDLYNMLEALYGDMRTAHRKGDTETVLKRIDEIAQKIEANIPVTNAMKEQYQDLLDYCRKNKFRVPEDMVKGDFADGFARLRKDNIGRINLTRDGVPIDSLYEEMSALWPEFFDSTNEMTQSDQLLRIIEVLDGIYTGEGTDAVNHTAQVDWIAEMLLDGYFETSTQYPHAYDEKKAETSFLRYKNDELLEAVEKYRKTKNVEDLPEVIVLQTPNEKTISELSEIVGFDVSGYQCKIERDAIVHIEDRHGVEGKHDHSLANAEDIARLDYIINHHDTIEFLRDENGNIVLSAKYNDRNNKNAPIILMSKKIDGTYLLGQAIPDSKRKTIWITSARIEKSDYSQVPNDQRSHSTTSETPPMNSSPDKIIAQKTGGVKEGHKRLAELFEKEGAWTEAEAAEARRLQEEETSEAMRTLEEKTTVQEQAERVEDIGGIKIQAPVFFGGEELARQMVETANSIYDYNRQMTRRMNYLLRRGYANREMQSIARDVAAGLRSEDYVTPGLLHNDAFQEMVDWYRVRFGMEDFIGAYRRKAKAEISDMFFGLLENSDGWKDKKLGAFYMAETAIRNLYDVAKGDENAAVLVKYLFDPMTANEANRNRWTTDWQKRISEAMKGLTEEERMLAQEYGEGLVREEELPTDKKEQIKRLEQELRAFYDTVFEQINMVLVLHGEKPIGNPTIKLSTEERQALVDYYQKKEAYTKKEGIDTAKLRQVEEILRRRGESYSGERAVEIPYFPHYTESNDPIQRTMEKFGIGMDATRLPTEISGKTQDFKPNRMWQRFFQHRSSDKPMRYDPIFGFDMYVHSVGKMLFHTDDITKMRWFINELRYKYSADGVREQLLDIRAKNLSITEEINQVNQVLAGQENEVQAQSKIDLTTLSHYVAYLEDYTNILAGKQALVDRAIQSLISRQWTRIERRISQNVVLNTLGMNLSSAVNNLIPLLESAAEEIADRNVVQIPQALADVMSRRLKKENYIERSDFLTNRWSGGMLSRDGLQAINEAMMKPTEFVDYFSVTWIHRTRYLANIKKGMSEEMAMREADRFTADIVADRSWGQLPSIFYSKNILVRINTLFMVEVNNDLRHMYKDLPRKLGEKGWKWLVSVIVLGELLRWLFNTLIEKVTGRRPAPSIVDYGWSIVEDITDPNVNGGEVIKNAMTNTSNFIPFTSTLFALFGLETNDRIPVVGNVNSLIANVLKGDWGKVGWTVASLANPLGGSNQLKKIVEGIGVIRNEESRGASGNMQYITEMTPQNILRVFLFGKSALPESVEWVEQGFGDLNQKKLYDAYVESLESGDDAELNELLAEMEEHGYDSVDELNKVIKKHEKTLEVPEEESTPEEASAISQKYDKVKSYDISVPEFMRVYNAQKNVKGDTMKDADGEEVTVKMSGNIKKKEAVEAATKGMSEEQRMAIYDALGIKVYSEGDIQKYNAARSAGKNPDVMTDSQTEKYNSAVNMGIDGDVYWAAYYAQSSVVSDKDENGKTIYLSKARKQKAAVDSVVGDLPVEQRKVLYEAFGISKKVW